VTVGMSEKTKNRVFEPFFTTKEGEVHGIGLSEACGIISRHNGEITVESEPGKGTTFTITLPVAGEKETETKKFTGVNHTIHAEVSKPVT
jgi:two-component system cell cycle sensor histidine kinase/response regulator CckA